MINPFARKNCIDTDYDFYVEILRCILLLKHPVAVALCNFTTSQKPVNPDVMRQMHEKLDDRWDVCKVTK